MGRLLPFFPPHEDSKDRSGFGSKAIRLSEALASYTYTDDANRYLEKLTYGNDDYVQYTYDKYGRVTQETFEDGDTVTYVYDNSGALATVTDSATGIKTTYYYDFTDRLMKYVETKNNFNHTVSYEYDDLNNLTSLVHTINGIKRSTSFSYDDDNRVSAIVRGNATKNYLYDVYGRLSQRITEHSSTVTTETYTYKTASNGAPTGQVQSVAIVGGDYSVTYSYTYDGNGNITSISDGINTTSYVYDSANQLIRENNQAEGKTRVWTYDDAGNILTRKEYAYTTGTVGTVLDTVTYTYGNSSWGDLLTGYDGTSITYDGIGNPRSDGTWTYSWEHGRELMSMTSATKAISYTYNADGLRASKTVNGVVHNYVYSGGKLIQESYGDVILDFSYDANGNPYTLTYTVGDATPLHYHYVLNLQGDVIRLVNSYGVTRATYEYDAWGNITNMTYTNEALANANPLRYRGYYYDQETGLYYLQSRYYNPTWGRFLNADGATSTGQGFIGNNMFAYCLNNPVNGYDPCGTCFHRWDFWNDCDVCKNNTLWDYVKESVDTLVHGSINSSSGAFAASVLRFVHYERNIFNQSLSEEELIAAGNEQLGEDQDKFHQNNQINGRNRKYVFNEGWFSSEMVFYSDGTVNNTPEDRGTFNVYYGDSWFGNYVVHGFYDVVPYMIWGNSNDDSTTIIDRIIMALG